MQIPTTLETVKESEESDMLLDLKRLDTYSSLTSEDFVTPEQRNGNQKKLDQVDRNLLLNEVGGFGRI